MLDLNGLRDSAPDSGPERIARVALVHHGFRSNQLTQADRRQARFVDQYASLGLLSLARSLEVDWAEGQLRVRPVLRYFNEEDFDSEPDMARAVRAWLETGSPAHRYVLASLYSLAYDRTAGLLRLLDPENNCLVVGGAHPTVAPLNDFAHLAVRGEGASAMRHILNTLFTDEFGTGPEARGICYTVGGDTTVDRPAFDRSLATIPSPAFRYDLVESESGHSITRVRWYKSLGERPQIYICTQSCRARCSFCSTYVIHGTLVSRPAALVEQDLQHVVGEQGHDSIEFHDDDLLQHDEWRDLLDVLRRAGVSWSCNARSEFMTPDEASRMRWAGCRKVFLGLESLNQDSLDYYRKNTTVEQNVRAVEALDGAGIGVIAGFIIGAPHDTLNSVLEEIDRMCGLPLFFLSSAILTPDIGTAEFSRAKKRHPEINLILESRLESGTAVNVRPRPEIFGEASPYGLPTVCDNLTKDELNELYALANSSFFLRPKQLRRIVALTADSYRHEVAGWLEVQLARARELSEQAGLSEVRRRLEVIVRDVDEGALDEFRDGAQIPTG